jgi:peptide/nickel transport system ATP-binding protein
MEEKLLTVRGLNIIFPGKPDFVAVKDLGFQLMKGETLAIVGESGSGKSLTALALMGLLPKNAIVHGSIELNDKTGIIPLDSILKDGQWESIRGKKEGIVFQEPMTSLNPVMTIGKQLKESITTHQHLSEADAKGLAIDSLRKVQLPEPAKLYNRYPHQLSGGQKQRVMIAMAMANKPSLLIADEPTTALDVTVQKEIISLMKHLQEETGTAMIFITHDLALASIIADEIMVMNKGEVMEYGKARQVLSQPANPYTKALIECKASPDQKGKPLPIVSDFLDAKDEALANVTKYASTVTTSEILKVQNLKVWFPQEKDWLGKSASYFKAVDAVSFTLNKGEVLGLVGESGCGKSTLSRAMMGLIPIYAGDIFFNGMNLSKISSAEWHQVRRKIQMIFQDPFASLNPRMTIGQILMEPMRVHNILPSAEIKKEAQRLLDIVHLPSYAFARYPHEFSGGQRQRIGIARALALRPSLIICDESVSALDVSVQAQILNLLKELQQQFDLSYLFISHDLSVVHYISDRVMVMQAGKIVESGTAEKVLEQPENDYTKKLVDSVPEFHAGI